MHVYKLCILDKMYCTYVFHNDNHLLPILFQIHVFNILDHFQLKM